MGSIKARNLCGSLQRKIPQILEDSSPVGGSADAPADFVRRIHDQGFKQLTHIYGDLNTLNALFEDPCVQ